MSKDVLYSIGVINYWKLWECLILPLHLTSNALSFSVFFALLLLFFFRVQCRKILALKISISFVGPPTHFPSPTPQKKILCQSFYIPNINLYSAPHLAPFNLSLLAVTQSNYFLFLLVRLTLIIYSSQSIT